LQKMGWHSSDTAHVRFDQVRVPARYLLGQESQGFREIMANFNGERLVLAAGCLGAAQCALDEALDWAQQRQTFGASLVNHQVVRHKLVDMQMRIRATEHWLIALATALDETGVESPEWVAEVCLLKNQATTTLAFCADAAVQTLGGMGFMRGTKSERIYREVKVNAIGGGTEEIMKELAAKQMGWL
jgi:acyl-CoA dehydrogenase